ncbi:MAG: hypothetical protein R3C18_18985 [Planctomycetaceae bacterium]
MQNNTFRIAFWTLLTSLGLCLTAAMLSPQAQLAISPPPATLPHQDGFVLAEYPRIKLGPPESFPTDWRVASTDLGVIPTIAVPPPRPAPVNHDAPSPLRELPVPSPYSARPIAPPPYEFERQQVAVAENAPEEPVDSNLQIASRTEIPSRVLTAPQPEEAEVISSLTATENHIYEELPPPPLVLDAPSVMDERANVPSTSFGESVLQTELLAEVQLIREQVTRIGEMQVRTATNPKMETESAPEEQTLRVEPQPWTPLKTDLLVETEAENVLTAESVPVDVEVTVSETVEPVEAVNEELKGIVIRAIPSELSDRWSFEFRNAPVSEVLVKLGEHAGTEVVVEAGIDEVFSRDFKNVDPRQALASVVKTFGFGVDVRGDYIFIRSERPLPKSR